MKKILLSLTFLFILIISSYRNTFYASFHFDDYPNIVHNFNIHLTDLSIDSLYQSFFTPTQYGKIYRPVAMLSFALNWYFGKEDVIGYHLVNISVHTICSFILFLCVLNLLKTPNLKDTYKGNIYCISFLTSAIWAIHPVQTQATTYIVQRMASLCALFYLIGIYYYVKFRLSIDPRRKTDGSETVAGNMSVCFNYKNLSYIFICMGSFILSLGAKENGVTFPINLLLMEIIFFTKSREKKILFIFALMGAFFLIFMTSSMIIKSSPVSIIFEGYRNFPFTLRERFLTEARILIFYFSLIIFPKADRFSLCHDVEISTSLLNPWTTLASTVALAGLIFYAFSPKKNNPLFSFAVLFFFLNHLVESTVIPLELIYEHRNYMPTLFLFLPVSAGISHALDYYQNKNTCIYRLIIILCAAVIGWISMETYKRNGVWISEKSLWENSIQNAPHLARPYHNLAHDHYEKIGDYDKALQLYQKAAGLKSVRMDEHNASFNNIGKIYYIKKEYDKALAYYSKALDINPDDETVLYNLTLVLMETEKWEEALEETDRLLTKSDSSIYRSMKGIVLMRMNRASEAVLYFEQVLKISPDDGRTTFYLGLALSLSGEYEKADAVLNRAKKLSIDKIAVYLYLLENCRKKNDHNCFDRYADAMLLEFSLDEVSEKTDMISHNPLMAPLSQGLAEAIREKAEHQESTLQNPLDETFGL